MRLDHPIFHEPLDAGVVLEESDWERDFDGRGVWTVQTGKLGEEVDYGVVSDGHGFEDSSDCERISGGVNSKGPWAVAIGRQANMLQWGFSAAPDRMTPSARRAFLNAIAYVKRFDGERPLVEKELRGRSWLEQYARLVGELDTLDPDHARAYREALPKRFPAGWIERVGLDGEALEALRRENEEYLWSESAGTFVVDGTLEELGVSNRTPAFLDLLVERLTADPEDAAALELAARYLGPIGCDARSALDWIAKNREWLFFSDVGGFRWLVDENAKRRAGLRDG